MNWSLRFALGFAVCGTGLSPSGIGQTATIGTDPFVRMAALSPGQTGDVIVRTEETVRLDAGEPSTPQDSLSGFRIQVYSIYPGVGGTGQILSVRQIYRDHREHQYYRIRFLVPDDLFPTSGYPPITFEGDAGFLVVTFRGTEIGSWPAKIYSSAPRLETDCENTLRRWPPTDPCPASFFHAGGDPVTPEAPARPGEKIHAFGTGFGPRATAARVRLRYGVDPPGVDPLRRGDFPLGAVLAADTSTPERYRMEVELPDGSTTEPATGVSTATLAIAGGLSRIEFLAVTR